MLRILIQHKKLLRIEPDPGKGIYRPDVEDYLN